MENGLFEFMALCAWLSVVVLVIGVFPGCVSELLC